MYCRSKCSIVASLWNLLDRCDEPNTILQQTLTLLKPGGYLFLAVVFPFCEFVEDG